MLTPSFVDADSGYRLAVEAPGRELSAAFAAAAEVPTIDLDGADITCAILLRMRSFFRCQDSIKRLLDKAYAAPAADFLVETVVFFLRVALAKLQPSLAIASERAIARRQGAMRPDISLWSGNQLIAGIECKTQLGWNRDGWLGDFEAREQRLAAGFPDARLFLLVMTGSNWAGFGADTRSGTQFFMLLNDIWPREFDESKVGLIFHRFEALIRQVLKLAEAHSPSNPICTDGAGQSMCWEIQPNRHEPD